MLPRPEASQPGRNSSDSFVRDEDKRFCRAAPDPGVGPVLGPVLRLAPGFAWASTNHHAVNGSWLFLRPLTNLSREIVLADSELFVHINQLLPGVLEEEAAGQEKKRRKQVGEEHKSIQTNGPSVVVEDYLPVRNQKFEAVHQKKTEGHEENQRD